MLWGVVFAGVTAAGFIAPIELGDRLSRVSERREEIIEGCLCLVASIVITVTGPHLIEMSTKNIHSSQLRRIPPPSDEPAPAHVKKTFWQKCHKRVIDVFRPPRETEWREKVENMSFPKQKLMISIYRVRGLICSAWFWLPFVTIWREVFEAIIFTYAADRNISDGGVALLAPVVVGIVAGITPGILLYW